MKPAQFLIAIPVPEPYASQVKAFRGANDRWSKPNMEPHVTVVPPQSFTWLPEELHRVQKLKFPQAKISFEGVASLKHERGRAIVAPCEKRDLQHAQEQVLLVFPKLTALVSENPAYHVTLANKVPDIFALDVEEAAEAASIRGTFAFETVKVYVRYNADPWHELTL